MKIAKLAFTAEFRDLAVKRVKAGGSVGGVAKELGGVEQALRNWVKAAAKGTPNGKGNRMVTPEERELSRLRAENARLKRELEIVKKAAAYFARDAL
ncbi:MAG: transposase [Candidatus Accumulibacter sp.]|nr:transposase [Accumulibacter sp.]